MSEKRYIVTRDDAVAFDRIMACPEGVQLDDCDIEWLEARELKERTCCIERAVLWSETIFGNYLVAWKLSCGHMPVSMNEPSFCDECGAEVVDR